MAGGADDELLLALLGEHLDDVEPLPANADDVIRAAFTFARIDEALADVLRDVDAMSGMRGTEDRTIVFGHGSASVEVHVEPDGEVTGQLDPPSPADVVLYRRSPAGDVTVDALDVDELGRFVVPGALTSFQLRVHPPGGAPFATPWTAA